MGNGFCNGTGHDVPVCECLQGWYGHDCSQVCLHGTPTPQNDACVCSPCFTGVGCEDECSNNGKCVNATCQCDTPVRGDAWFGPLCEDRGCPGDDGSCSGQGTCDAATSVCSCYPGWKGDGCNTPVCPGTPECSGRGTCEEGGVCACLPKYAGVSCELECVNGTNPGTGVCQCDLPCITGVRCDHHCSHNGNCTSTGACECDSYPGYKGPQCDVLKCPGWPEDCSGHGTCNEALHECDCEAGWKGRACEFPLCPGNPQCNGVEAECKLGPGENKPRCFDCKHPYMGDACELRCVHGMPTRYFDGNWECLCEPCYSGVSCEGECSNRGQCNKTVGQCDCGYEGGRGVNCEVNGCPGWGRDCTGHGVCNSITGQCTCNSGWSGRGCDIPSCPQNCNNHGSCHAVGTQPTCQCDAGRFGSACQYGCLNGTVHMEGEEETCVCDPCFSGPFCDVSCSGTGNCMQNGTCDCGFRGGRGDYCELPGCPGYGSDCSGKGTCNKATGNCVCNEGWKGQGCESPDCIDNCNDRGHCDSSVAVPICRNCDEGWMGVACEIPCNGTQQPMDSGICVCDSQCQHGKSCQHVCSGVGTCSNNTCDCAGPDNLNLGWWGRYCETRGCPGIGSICSSHGTCISATLTCVCDPGWYGSGCHLPDCPGTPDCNGRGQCVANSNYPECLCDDDWMGRECELPCVNGTAQHDFTCDCDPCFAGPGCDQLCSNHGACENGTCTCNSAWWGTECQVRGCPGVGISCSGHGYCTIADQTCTCNRYWTGDDCNSPDCPGDPLDCNGKGHCDGVNYFPPRCINCTLSMGEACERPCVHGYETQPFSTICNCDPCYSDPGCETECSAHGSCANATCQCQTGFKGDHCEVLDCPGEPDCGRRGQCARIEGESVCVCNAGFTGDDCSILVCPGTPACSAHGNCTVPVGSSAPRCICDHGFDGAACDVCLPRFTGSMCDRCEANYIGYNTDCSVLCIHGDSDVPGGDVCVCHNAEVKGHWTGASCDQCIVGWRAPTCTECDTDYVGQGHCTIPCINNQGILRQQGDNPDPKDMSSERLPLRPAFRCYTKESDGAMTAWFGYDNRNMYNVYVAEGAENSIGGRVVQVTTATGVGKVVTKFSSGLVEYAMSIRLAGNATEVWWHVAYSKANSVVNASFSLAGNEQYQCANAPTLTKPSFEGNYSDYCHCLPGYWGPACQHTCPGGATNPCYGNGVCDAETGQCSCYTGARQDTNCQGCEDGWFGTDCSIAMLDSPASTTTQTQRMGASYGSGHITTFDGSMYTYQRPGEHVLLNTTLPNRGPRCRMHGKFIMSSTSGSVLMQAFGVTVGSNVLEIHVLSTGAVFAYNGAEITVLSLPASLGSGVVCSAVSTTHVRIQSGTALTVDIDLREMSVDVKIIASFQVCNLSQGLLSSCSDTPWPHNDFVMHDGTKLTEQSHPYLNQTSIHLMFGPSWIVATADSIFQYISVRSPVSGFGLKFAHSHAVSDPLHVFSNPDAAIEAKFRLDSLLGTCQTVWSYRAGSQPDVTLSVCSGGKINVHCGTTDYVTSLTVQASVWYHLAVSWASQAGLLNIILLQDQITISSANIFVSTGPRLFFSGGSLVIGKRSLLYVDVLGHSWNLQGVVDDVRVWKRSLTIMEIRQRFSAYYLSDAFLTCHWVFEEGTGRTTVDLVAGIRMRFPDNPWWHPVWFSVDFPYTLPSLSVYNIYSRLLTKTQSSLSTFCSQHMYTARTNSSCGYLGQAAIFAFYRQCVYNSDVFSTAAASMEVVVSLADICQHYSSQSATMTWPARDFCHNFPDRNFPVWRGQRCLQRCLSGWWAMDTSSCTCFDGFHGSSCEGACPVSKVGVACGGGTCSSGGSCSCSLNRNASTSCQQCADGWGGSDCSIAMVTDSARIGDTRVCSVFAFSHIIMFDGQAYNFDTAGEFTLHKTQDVEFYSRLVPCPGNKAVCMTSMWIRATSDNLTIAIPAIGSSDSGVAIWHNGTQLFEDSVHLSDLDLSLTKFSPTNIDITVGSTLTVNVAVQDFLLTVAFTSHTSRCGTAVGLCGNCDGKMDNDFVTASGPAALTTVNSAFINGDFAQHWSIGGWPLTGFIYTHGAVTEPRTPSGDGFSLKFSGSAAYTRNLPGVKDSSDVSFEVKFRPDRGVDGTVFVYVAVSKISIAVNESLLAVVVDGKEYRTTVAVEIDILQHLTVVISQSSNSVTLYLVIPGVAVRTAVITLTVSLRLGNGQINIAGSNDGITRYFYGVVDEVRVWTRALTIYEILQTASVRVDVSYVGVLAVWSLSEGTGLIAVDSISHLELFLPQSGVFWVYSAVFWSDLTVYYTRHTSLPEQPGTSCERLRTDTAISDACSRLGTAVLSYAFRACIGDVQVSTSSEVFAYNSAGYISYCLHTLRPSHPPTNAICQNRQDPLYNQLCRAACKFGEIDDESGVCKCHMGYWGFDCSKLCPGGTANPCHRMGFCNATNGVCECQPTWSQATDCSACKDGWSGPDCAIYQPPTPPPGANDTVHATRTYTLSMFGFTHMISFTGATFTLRQAGEFYLIRNSVLNFDLQVRVIFCQEATLCVSAVGIKLGSETIVIRAGFSVEDFAQVWVNGVLIKSPAPNTISAGLTSLVLAWNSLHEYTMMDTPSRIHVKVRTDERHITLTLQANSTLCANLVSCGMCSYNHTDTSDTTMYTAWRVSTEFSLFSVIFLNSSILETAVISPAVYSLGIKGDGVSSDILPDVFLAGQDVTFALLVKPTGGEGVVMSYGKFSLFGLVYDSSVKVVINGTSHDMGLVLKLGVWNDLVVVYTATLYRFDVYVHNADSVIVSQHVVVSTHFLFEADGVVTLGGWVRIQGEGTGAMPLITGFHGEVDELRVWHRAVTYTEVERVWVQGGIFSVASVFVRWHCNEGQGTVMIDTIRKYRFTFFAYDWTRASVEWRLSTAVYTHPAVPATHIFTDSESLRISEAQCHSSLYSTTLSSPCSSLHSAFIKFYYAVCLSDIAGIGHTSAALSTVVAFSDLCVLTFKLDVWPARYVCGQFEFFPRYRGQSCSLDCLFPQISQTDISTETVPQTCQCWDGFWGAQCQSVCPSGVVSPCGGHGSCVTSSGQCVCDVGWGGTDCSTCAPGWHGSDCSVIKQPVSNSHFCSLTANSHLATLDGAGVTFTQDGIFQLFKNTDLSLRVDVVTKQCHTFGTCILSAALQVSTDTVIVDSMNTTHRVVNRVNTEVTPDVGLSGGFRLVALDKSTYELQHGQAVTIRMSIREAYMDVTVTAKSCSASGGLCGQCVPNTNNACGANDHACLLRELGIAGYLQRFPSASSTTIIAYLATWKTDFTNSIFATASIPSSPGAIIPDAVVIQLTGGLLVTAPIPAHVLQSDHITIELNLKLSAACNLTSMVVWTFAQTHIFAILIQNGNLAVYFRGTVLSTSISVHVDVWTNIAVFYHSGSGHLVLHYLWESGTVVRHVYEMVAVGIGAFPGAGTLAIGAWQISLVSEAHLQVARLLGVVQKVFIWTRRLTPDDIINTWLHVHLIPPPGLALGWLVNVGSGDHVLDIVRSHRLTVSTAGTSWVYVNINVRFNIKVSVRRVGAVYLKADTVCRALFQQQAMTSACGSLTPALSFFQVACVQDVVAGRESNWSMSAVVTFASQCQTLTGSPKWPAQGLCGAFPSRHFPVYIGRSCDRQCAFGKFDRQTEVCVCDEGSWGDNCNKRCPGIAGRRPCNGNGRCDQTTGGCLCEPHWQGDAECSTCTSGYTGRDCSIVAPRPPVNPPKHATCAAGPSGDLNMFDGHGVTLQQFSTYYLFRVDAFSVKFTQVDCPAPRRSDPCIQSVTVTLHDKSVLISCTSPRAANVRVNGWKVDASELVSAAVGDCELSVVQSNPWTYTVEIPQMELVMSVNIFQYLMVTLSINTGISCTKPSEGLCGVSTVCPSPLPPLPCGLQVPATVPPGNSGSLTVNQDDDKTSVNAKTVTLRVHRTQNDTVQYQDGTGPGKMIECEDSSAITAPLTHIANIRSIEFLIKSCPESRCHGVIISYATKRSFTVRLTQTIVVAHSGDRIDTGLVITNNTWHLLTLTYDPDTENLRVYLVKSRENIQYADVPLPQAALEGGGQLSLGKWVPTSENSRDQPRRGFIGHLDELRIWDRYIDNTEVADHWNVNYVGNEPGLVYLWKFDDIVNPDTEDANILDVVHKHRLFLPSPPFPSAKLVFSDAPIPFRLSATTVTVPFVQVRPVRRKRQTVVIGVDQQRYQTCEDIFVNSGFASLCLNASSSVQTQYLFHCYTSLQMTGGDLSATEDAILGYATYCQQVLDLQTWPAQSLCNDQPQIADATVVRSLCGVPCYFGSKSVTDSNHCVCQSGYWGPACDQPCPGGADTPCSGLGTCGQQSGTCNCPVNREGVACSACSVGWLGDNCLVSDSNLAGTGSVASSVSWLQPLGHVVNADGLGFYVSSPGVYSLLAAKDRVQVQSKFIRCFENFTCASFVSVLVGDSTNGYARVTVQAPTIRDSKPDVYLGSTRTTLDVETFFTGSSVARRSLTEVVVTVIPDLTIQISTSGMYLTVTVHIPTATLSSTSGLLSGRTSGNSSQKLERLTSDHNAMSLDWCNGGVVEQMPLSAPSAVDVLSGMSPVVLATHNSSMDFSRFVVPECEVFIQFPSPSHRLQSNSGFSLHTGGSAVYTNFSLLDTAVNVTVDLMVRLLENAAHRQALLAFTNHNLFLLYLNNSIITLDVASDNSINTTSYSTNIRLEVGRWNKLVLAYDGTSGQLTLYHFNSSAWLERRDYIIHPHAFSSPGVLALGSWQPPFDGHPHPRVYPFVGEIENLLVWDHSIEPNLILDVWLMDPSLARSALHSAWTFDEGAGLQAVDAVGSQSLDLPAPPLSSPHWLASDVEYLLTRTSGSVLLQVLKAGKSASPLSATGASICKTYIMDLNYGNCSQIGQATKQDLYSLCMYSLSVVQYREAALGIILNYAAMCAGTSTTPPSLKQTICAADTLWLQAPICSDCTFGTASTQTSLATNTTNQCACAKGYYGLQCQNVCPGGSATPCNLHGDCQSNGSCWCDWNWRGSSDCGSCTTHVTGRDCSILSSAPMTFSGKTVGVITSTADVVTLTGLHLALSGLRGVYTLFKAANSARDCEVQVMLVSCSSGSCIAAVAVGSGGHNLTVLPSARTALPAVYYDGSQLLLPANHSLSTFLTLRMTSVDHLSISIDNSVEATITLQGAYTEVMVKADPTACSSASGILDLCQPVAQSLYGSVTNMSRQNVQDQVKANFTVTGSQILLQTSPDGPHIFASDDVSSVSSYSLSLNGTSAWSGPVTVGSSAGLTDFTISLHIKPASYGGTILSFGKSSAFAITNTNPVKIKCGAAEINTGLALELSKWNQIIVSVLESAQTIHFFVYGQDTTIQHRVFSQPCSAAVVSGAIMSLGEVVPSPDDGAYILRETFRGEVEELVVWSAPIPVAVVYQVYKMDVDVAAFGSILASVIKLNEGLGSIAHDNLLSANSLLLPPSPWPAPIWELSDLELVTSSSSHVEARTSPDPVYVAACNAFFTSATVTSACSLTNVAWFHAACVQLAATSRSTEGAVIVMATFLRVCGSTGVDTSSADSVLCAMDVTLPAWLQRECAGCDFGVMTGNTTGVLNLMCTCLPGFWGDRCQNSCPGGVHSPCNNHGTCADDGSCWCDRHWAGDDCGVCASGWKGNDCIISRNLTTATSATATSVFGQVTPLGRLVTFDGVTLDIVNYGTFYLIQNTQLKISLAVQVIPCSAGLFSSHCVGSLIIKLESYHLEVNHKGFSKDKVTLFGQSSDVFVHGSVELGNLQFVYTSFSKLRIISKDWTLNVTITVIDTNLLITVAADTRVWLSVGAGTSGLLAACSTELSIQFSKCLNETVRACSPADTTVLPAGCDQGLSLSALLTFLTVHQYTATTSSSQQGTIITKACVKFNNSGTIVRAVSLPSQHFSLEFHVKMDSSSGVFLAYMIDTNVYFVLGYSGTEVVVMTSGMVVKTGLTVTVGVWSQILISWNSALSTVEIYVTDAAGVLSFKSVRLNVNVFVSGGMLTLGQTPPELSLPMGVGIFRGLVDEVRVWSRPTNPSIVGKTWRMDVENNTPDVYLHWPLDDGQGMTASERKRRSTMYALDVKNPPSWDISDLTLTPLETPAEAGFGTTQTDNSKHYFPVAPATNATSLAQAEKLCHDLINALASVFSATTPDLSALEKQCTHMVYATGNQLSAELSVLALAELQQERGEMTSSPLQVNCHLFTALTSVLPYSGPNCSDSCLFGYTMQGSSCICYNGHWGSRCDQLCPYSISGVCNVNGLCSDLTGACFCSSRWLQSTVTSRDYWTSIITLQVDYACTTCTHHWSGADCSVTVQTVTVEVEWRAAIAVGSYVTIFDRASFSLTSPGTYLLLSVEGVSMHALYLPCPGVRLCRFMSQVSIKIDTFLLIITLSPDRSNFTLLLTFDSQQQEISIFPFSKTYGRATFRWWVREYVRVTVDNKLIVIIGASPMGLTLGTKLHQDWFTRAWGVFGTVDNNHITDLLPPTSTPTSDADVTATSIDHHLRQQFMVVSSGGAGDLEGALPGRNLTGCGHMLRLIRHYVDFTGLDVAIVTQRLTVTFWLRVDTQVPINTKVMEMVTSVGVVVVSVQQQQLMISWLGTSMLYLRPANIQTWTYLAMSWDGSGGSLTAFAIQEVGFDYGTISTVSIAGQQLTITAVTFLGSGTESAAVEVDLLRVWQASKPLEDIVGDLKTYRPDTTLDPQSSMPVLMVSAGFDEGEGASSNISIHASGTDASPVKRSAPGVLAATGTASSVDQSPWTPSTIPVLDVVLPEDLTHTTDTGPSAQACLHKIQEKKLSEHCTQLEAFLSLYLEACVREHQRTDNVNITVTLANLFAFYCQTTNNVNECELDGYVDFCAPVEEENEFPTWAIIIICIGVVVAGAACCCCIVFFIKKKKKKQEERERRQSGPVSPVFGWGEDETTFSHESTGSLDFENPTFSTRTSPFGALLNRPPIETQSQTQAGVRQKHKRTIKVQDQKPKGKSLGKVKDVSGDKVDVKLQGFAYGIEGQSSRKERPHSASSGQHHSDFAEKPHVQAWSGDVSAGHGHKKNKRGQGGKEDWLHQVLKDPQHPPIGFYTANDTSDTEEADVFIYNPEADERMMDQVNKHLIGTAFQRMMGASNQCPTDEARGAAAIPPQTTSLPVTSFRHRENSDDPGTLHPPKSHVFRMVSVPSKERVVLDELEVEAPQPIIFRHDGNNYADSHPSTRQVSRRSSRPGTAEHINLAFDEDCID